jgi:hypothetical protein
VPRPASGGSAAADWVLAEPPPSKGWIAGGRVGSQEAPARRTLRVRACGFSRPGQGLESVPMLVRVPPARRPHAAPRSVWMSDRRPSLSRVSKYACLAAARRTSVRMLQQAPPGGAGVRPQLGLLQSIPYLSAREQASARDAPVACTHNVQSALATREHWFVATNQCKPSVRGWARGACRPGHSEHRTAPARIPAAHQV